MKTPSTWNFRSIMGKAMMGLVLAAMIGGINVVPAHSRDDNRRMERHDRDRYEKRGRGHDRGNYYYKHGRRYYRQPVYRERVYVAPPPVVYAPPEPPGISLFLPPIIFR
jgi:hypothetical protein